MPKNIIICCDGTDNLLTVDENTNVLHLYSCLDKEANQLAYYNPGVGTFPKSKKKSFWNTFSILKDKVVASSLDGIVLDAYAYLMNHYEDGDSIYFFGFSRGAYSVRMLCGMLDLYGLMDKGNENHLKYILDVYYMNDKDKFEIANKFKKRFSREVRVHFLGIWDTVVSVGGPFAAYSSFPNSRKLDVVDHVRHAVSIDERRKHFRLESIEKVNFYQKYKDEVIRSSYEVYFSGVHSDVGGGYSEEGLSKIALRWMIGEASEFGLKLDKKKVGRYVYGNDKRTKYQKPNYLMKIHNSLKEDNKWIYDLMPRRRWAYDNKDKHKNSKKILYKYYDWAIAPRRFIPLTALFHESVILKMNHKEDGHNYSPKNIKHDIPEKCVVKSKPIIYRTLGLDNSLG